LGCRKGVFGGREGGFRVFRQCEGREGGVRGSEEELEGREGWLGSREEGLIWREER
jgi:hypothetical protein